MVSNNDRTPLPTPCAVEPPPDIRKHAAAFTKRTLEHFKWRHEYDRLLAELDELSVKICRPPDYRTFDESTKGEERRQHSDLRSQIRKHIEKAPEAQ